MDNSVDNIFKDKFSFLFQIKIRQLNENYKNQLHNQIFPELTQEEYIKILAIGCEVINLDYTPNYMPLHYIKGKRKLRALELECDERDVVECLKNSLVVNGDDMRKNTIYLRLIYRIKRFYDDDEIGIRIIYGIG